jgi:hypothetical protein
MSKLPFRQWAEVGFLTMNGNELRRIEVLAEVLSRRRTEYAPDRRIAVVVLSNVNGDAPQNMSDQLLSVALGKPVVLPSEHKAVPIAKDQLTKFIGVFDLSPTFSLTIAVTGDELTAQVRDSRHCR